MRLTVVEETRRRREARALEEADALAADPKAKAKAAAKAAPKALASKPEGKLSCSVEEIV
jgi:hypothetical protein